MQVSTFAPNMAVRRRNLGNLFVCCQVCLSRHIYQQLNCRLAVCVDAAAAEAPFQAAKHSKKPTRRLQKSGGAFSFTLSVEKAGPASGESVIQKIDVQMLERSTR